MMSSERIGILVATMTGTAEMAAEEVTASLAKAGVASTTLLMDDLGADALADFDAVVIISSTYGHGDIPDNGQALYESIEGVDNLRGRRFAVFGLGDRTYAATFCEAGRKWDDLFSSKGATRFAPLVQHDAGSGTLAEDEAGSWAAQWVKQLEEVA